MVQKDMIDRVYAHWTEFLGCDYSDRLFLM